MMNFGQLHYCKYIYITLLVQIMQHTGLNLIYIINAILKQGIYGGLVVKRYLLDDNIFVF